MRRRCGRGIDRGRSRVSIVAAAQRSTNPIFTSLKTARKEIFENSRSPLLPRWLARAVLGGWYPARLRLFYNGALGARRLSMYNIDRAARATSTHGVYASRSNRATCPSARRANAVVPRSWFKVHDDFAAVSAARSSRSRW